MTKSKGTIKFFNTQKGFGFITPDNGGKELFVHITQVQGDPQLLQPGQQVTYMEKEGRKGLEAGEVTLV